MPIIRYIKSQNPIISNSKKNFHLLCIKFTVILNYLFYTKIASLFVEIKCQLDATEIFIADLIACSTCFGHHYAHHQELEYYTVVAVCGISCCGFQVAGLVWS